MRTTPIITFGRNALTMKYNSSYSALDAYPWADLDGLKSGHVASRFASYEPNFWKLDGDYKFLPTGTANVGLIMNTMSDGAGYDGNEPILTVDFRKFRADAWLFPCSARRGTHGKF